MNVLLLSNSDSVFVRDFCLHVLKEESINAVILEPSLSENYGKEYNASRIREVKWPDSFLTSLFKRLDMFVLRIKERKKLEKEIGFGDEVDVLHMHYVEPMHLIYFYPFWKKAGKRVLTFWGSDIYRASALKIKLFPYFLKHSTSIVFMIQNQCDYFQTIFGHKYDDKIHVIDFGNSLLDVIDQVKQKYTIEDCRQHFGLSLDRYIVHIGYNAHKEQQHIEIIKNIILLSPKIYGRMQFVFHMSYGWEDDYDDYKQQLIELMDTAGMDYVFIDSYLQGEELAMFRSTCDLFVYGQSTDARSASPLEYIYAGAKFVCPGWLADNYELLDRAEINYYVYEEFSELPETIQSCVETMGLPGKQISEQGRKGIRDEISWDSLAPKWRKLYE